MTIRFYKDLDVWQKSMDLVEEVYRVSQQFPSEERFGLTNQIRRSEVSIPANIAEAHGRLHLGDYIRFLSIARGSLMETETHLAIAIRLGFVEHERATVAHDLIQHVGRLLNGLIRALQTKL